VAACRGRQGGREGQEGWGWARLVFGAVVLCNGGGFMHVTLFISFMLRSLAEKLNSCGSCACCSGTSDFFWLDGNCMITYMVCSLLCLLATHARASLLLWQACHLSQ
jgi:hypothetical protein